MILLLDTSGYIIWRLLVSMLSVDWSVDRVISYVIPIYRWSTQVSSRIIAFNYGPIISKLLNCHNYIIWKIKSLQWKVTFFFYR